MKTKIEEPTIAEIKAHLREAIHGWEDSYTNRIGRTKGKITDAIALHAIACLNGALGFLSRSVKYEEICLYPSRAALEFIATHRHPEATHTADHGRILPGEGPLTLVMDGKLRFKEVECRVCRAKYKDVRK